MSKEERSNRAVTADDVASLAGVSRSAVSRTFTEGASVAPATRDKVMGAAKILGYRVNFLARGLSQQRTNLVALVVSDMDNSLRAQLVDRLARGLVALGFRPLILPAEPGESAGQLIDMMLHYNVTGTIVTSDTPPAEIAQECAAYGVPLVLINKPDVGSHVANVSMDWMEAGRLAAEELLACGCKRVGITSQRRPSHSISQRKTAFITTCRALALEIVGDFQGAAQNYAGGVEAGQAFVESGLTLDGMYCLNDYLALGFLDELRRSSLLRVPDDIKLVACDDIAEAAWGSYDLTTVRQEPQAVSDVAIGALQRCLAKPQESQQHVIIPAKLVLRGSTRSDLSNSSNTTRYHDR